MYRNMIIKDFSEMTAVFPDIVYKYRSWTDDYHKTIINKRVVYMAPPMSFEDPKDCKGLVRYDLMSDDDIFKMYLYQSKEDNPQRTISQHRRHAKDWTKKKILKDHEHIRKLQEDNFKEFSARFGVLSVTGNPLNVEMWNKYSDMGQGFCVGYKSEILFRLMGSGGDVNYVEDLPNIFWNDDFETRRSKQIFYKESKWEFEQEYRLTKFWPNPAFVQQRCIEVPCEAYLQIIFGWNMPEGHKEEIIRYCKEQDIKVKLFQASIVKEDVQIRPYAEVLAAKCMV